MMVCWHMAGPFRAAHAVAVLLVLLAAGSLTAEPVALPGESSDWHGFPKYELQIGGVPVQVVAPRKVAPGRPWVWHGEFFGHKPAPDIELLRRGFHAVYVRVPDMLGAPRAVEHWNAVYAELTQKYGLAPKVALVGLSRGGLYCYNWAAANPQKVACIYADAPVCDFKSWPGGKGAGPGSERDWKLVLERYGFANEAEALAYPTNPVDNLEALAKAGVPLLHVFGNADEVVPWEENTGLLAERYRKLGGSITLIEKPDVRHHPHGLADPTLIVEFIEKHSTAEGAKKYAPRRRDVVDRKAAEIEADRLVIYRAVDERELYLHVLEPEDWQRTDRRPCFVIIHGGGWTGGEPRRMYPFAQHFTDRGMVGISVQYRLHDPKTGTTVFDCVDDVHAAVRFVKQKADLLGIDPQRIIVCGGSAGGHLAMETALVGARQTEANLDHSIPAALVLLFPVIDTSPQGYGSEKLGPRWRELSPLHQVSGKVPPTLIFHGTADTVTPFAGAVAFQEAMRKLGNRCELESHPGGQHGYLMNDDAIIRKTLVSTEAFLDSLKLMPN